MIDKKLEILKSGRALFSEKGFKDTNVSEITKHAGIATGTFYNYYTSKDNLFMDIFIEENVKLKKEILEQIDLDANPMEVIGAMIHLNNLGMQSNPILREWYNQDVFSKLEKVYREEVGAEGVNFIHDSFIDVFKMWQEQGKIRRDIEVEMIMAIFGALINVDTHKEEVGLQYFPEVMTYLSEFIMKGLMSM